jgi:hypothetical protein
MSIRLLEYYILEIPAVKRLGELIMAQKKIERKKELDRRRHRREQRLKARIRDAKAAAKK